MSRVAVIGSNGQLGSDLVDVWRESGDDVAGITHDMMRVEDPDSVAGVLRSVKPDIILNTAAYHNLPKCESDPALSGAVNASGSLHVARIAQELGAAVVYFSTDYVFDGEGSSPYREEDLPNPQSVYATTKLAGEFYALNYCDRGYVVRVSGIYGRVPCRAKGGNFVTTMMRLAREKPEVRVVTDERLTPTPTRVIAQVVRAIVRGGPPGLYHATNEGDCSWFEFATVIFSTLNIGTPLRAATSAEFPSAVRRPAYSVLDNGMLKRHGLPPMRQWREALIDFLTQPHAG